MTDEQRKNNLRKSQKKYQRKLRSFIMRFRKREDADVIRRLEGVGNVTDYIRRLVRADIARGKE